MPIERKFLRIEHWESLQPKHKPRKPDWIKSEVGLLQVERWRELSLTVRGVYGDLCRLAATCGNRIPYSTSRFVANSLACQPQVVGKSIATLIRLGFVSEFAESETDNKNNDMTFLRGPDSAESGRRSYSYSRSTTPSQQTGTESNIATGADDDFL